MNMNMNLSTIDTFTQWLVLINAAKHIYISYISPLLIKRSAQINKISSKIIKHEKGRSQIRLVVLNFWSLSHRSPKYCTNFDFPSNQRSWSENAYQGPDL